MQILQVCVCVCGCHVLALLAFHTAEHHKPTSRQTGHRVDMQLSVKETEKKLVIHQQVKEVSAFKCAAAGLRRTIFKVSA